MKEPDTIITICMGSSCFSRGNNLNVAIIERFLREHKLDLEVEIRGCLCSEHCKTGPNILIGDTLLSGVQPSMVNDLLAHHLLRKPR